MVLGISNDFGDGDALISDTDDNSASMATDGDVSKHTTGTNRDSFSDHTPNTGTISNSAPRRLISRNSDNNENRESSVQPLQELTNYSATAASNDTQEILKELKKANSRLDRFAENLKAIETRLTSVEEHCVKTPSCSSCAEESGGKVQQKVPAKVLVCLESTYLCV